MSRFGNACRDLASVTSDDNRADFLTASLPEISSRVTSGRALATALPLALRIVTTFHGATYDYVTSFVFAAIISTSRTRARSKPSPAAIPWPLLGPGRCYAATNLTCSASHQWSRRQIRTGFSVSAGFPRGVKPTGSSHPDPMKPRDSRRHALPRLCPLEGQGHEAEHSQHVDRATCLSPP